MFSGGFLAFPLLFLRLASVSKLIYDFLLLAKWWLLLPAFRPTLKTNAFLAAVRLYDARFTSAMALSFGITDHLSYGRCLVLMCIDVSRYIN